MHIILLATQCQKKHLFQLKFIRGPELYCFETWGHSVEGMHHTIHSPDTSLLKNYYLNAYCHPRDALTMNRQTQDCIAVNWDKDNTSNVVATQYWTKERWKVITFKVNNVFINKVETTLPLAHIYSPHTPLSLNKMEWRWPVSATRTSLPFHMKGSCLCNSLLNCH